MSRCPVNHARFNQTTPTTSLPVVIIASSVSLASNVGNANPQAAGMQQGFFYDFSKYGIHDRLSNDGITQWHPAFLSLGKTLDECATNYRGFCKKYRPKPKPESKNHWGSKLLSGMKVKGKPKKSCPGQLKLPWADWDDENPEISEVAEKFVMANGYKPQSTGREFLLS